MKLKKEISRFQYEDMCARDRSVFPISTVCNARCMFCSNKNNPFTVHKVGFRPLSEVKEYVFRGITDVDSAQPICLSDAIPGRISEGEALLHPHFFEVCRLIRSATAHRTIHITTNGALLTEETIEKMAQLQPFHVMISYHSTNFDKWNMMFGGAFNETHHHNATMAWRRLREAGIKTTGAIVCMANVLGYDDIEKTLLFMNKHYIDSVQVWEPGYSERTDQEIKEKMEVDPEEFKQFVHSMHPKCDNTVLLWNRDPTVPLVFNPYDIMIATVNQVHRNKNVYWLTGECAYDRLTADIAEYNKYIPNNHTVVKVKNHTYGGNINCNGLLMIADLQTAVNELHNPDIILIPDVMLDNLGNDLMEVNYQTLTHTNNPLFWWRH